MVKIQFPILIGIIICVPDVGYFVCRLNIKFRITQIESRGL